MRPSVRESAPYGGRYSVGRIICMGLRRQKMGLAVAEHARVGPVIGVTVTDVASLPRESLPGLLAGLAALQGAVAARLLETPARELSVADEQLTADQAAQRTGMSARYLYKHARELPFARRTGRAVRFSARGIDKWLASKKG